MRFSCAASSSNSLYHFNPINPNPPFAPKNENGSRGKGFHPWLKEEREAWAEAMQRDPLLTDALLPLGCTGSEAWRQRQAVMLEAARRMRVPSASVRDQIIGYAAGPLQDGARSGGPS